VEKDRAPVQRLVAACVVEDEHGAVCLEDEQSETTANGNDMFSQLSQIPQDSGSVAVRSSRDTSST
jgi:hypothetical protein